MWVICNSNNLDQLKTKSNRKYVDWTVTLLLQKNQKGDSRYICLDEGSKLRLREWKNILELETYTNDAGGISYGSLRACDMWRTVLGENEIHFGWHHVRRKSYEGKTILETGSDPRRYHRIVPLDKYHYNFSVPLFWLQFSRILRRIKKIISIHSVLH